MRKFLLNAFKTRIKKIPIVNLVSWGILGLLSIASLIAVLQPPYRQLEDLKEQTIKIDEARIHNSKSRFGSSMRLEIISENCTFYLSFPDGYYKEIAPQIESELLSGETSQVTIKTPRKQTLTDRLYHRVFIAELQSDSGILFNIEASKEYLKSLYISAWAGFLLFPTLWIGDTIFHLYVYKVTTR